MDNVLKDINVNMSEYIETCTDTFRHELHKVKEHFFQEISRDINYALAFTKNFGKLEINGNMYPEYLNQLKEDEYFISDYEVFYSNGFLAQRHAYITNYGSAVFMSMVCKQSKYYSKKRRTLEFNISEMLTHEKYLERDSSGTGLEYVLRSEYCNIYNGGHNSDEDYADSVVVIRGTTILPDCMISLIKSLPRGIRVNGNTSNIFECIGSTMQNFLDALKLIYECIIPIVPMIINANATKRMYDELIEKLNKIEKENNELIKKNDELTICNMKLNESTTSEYYIHFM